jgi:hypothetical protein
VLFVENPGALMIFRSLDACLFESADVSIGITAIKP